ncbi:MAG: beta-ketoacyl synthase chain length factor [Bacteroidota bacterium]|nr:beta-ketoacyl synthase chain length factor [Bacteroidota bacterium]
MNNCYINGVSAISAQESFTTSYNALIPETLDGYIYRASVPNYKEYLASNISRRLSDGLKIGITCAFDALKNAQKDTVDAIIIGTGMGCTEDSEKFLKAVLDNHEQHLTPTSFIQSTHNTVGAQLAILLKCNGYNFTYVNESSSFEAALLDGLLQIQNQEANTILLGGIDEYSAHTYSLLEQIGHIKTATNNSGTCWGEGASFFVLNNIQNDTTYAQIIDVDICHRIQHYELQIFINNFLKKNKLSFDEIDAVVLGKNGDIEFDLYFDKAAQLFPKSTLLQYKNISGEYHTASAFGLWMAAQIIKNNLIWDKSKINSVLKSEYKTILLYNQYRGVDHSLILIRKI